MNIKEYLFTIVATSALGIIADIAVKGGKQGSVEKYVRLAVTLCVLSCIIMPISQIKLDNSIFDENGYLVKNNPEIEINELYIAEKESEGRLSLYIYQKYGIKPVSVSIDMILRKEENLPELKEINIVLENKEKEEYRRISEELSNELKTKVSVKGEE